MREFALLNICFAALFAMLQDDPTVLKPAPDEVSAGPEIIFPTIRSSKKRMSRRKIIRLLLRDRNVGRSLSRA